MHISLFVSFGKIRPDANKDVSKQRHIIVLLCFDTSPDLCIIFIIHFLNKMRRKIFFFWQFKDAFLKLHLKSICSSDIIMLTFLKCGEKMIKDLILKYKSMILYLIFGALTTFINIAIYTSCYYLLNTGNTAANIISWVFSVLFAYITNKLFVFESKSFSGKVLLKEIISFFSCRAVSGLMDIIIMFVAVDIFCLTAWFFKILSNVIVLILNYIFSKTIVFSSRRK